ncbi:expressed unknown protein [Seminavis robusta]|uniref:VWFA domain-containing protein n=1 Tax=Seminavis robusta TaxID=568900 RepID=A0A9N8DQZ8_9STRA|nr:expressed unknown protein [Seminavis robusta]|eukprot:Sro309_g113690.1 n/a (405) ;mRNA; f:6706-8255
MGEVPTAPFAQAKPLDDAEIFVQARPVPFVMPTTAAPVNPLCAPTTTSLQSSGRSPYRLIGDHSVARLRGEGYTNGLIQTLAELKQTVAKQVWIVDDSGSMLSYDGKLIQGEGLPKFTKCTRWEELQQTVIEHIKLAGALQLPTSIRLLNRKERDLNICLIPGSNVEHDVEHCVDVLWKSGPNAGTPLKRHIVEVRRDVENRKGELEAAGKVVSIVIATDGLPTDASHEDFVDELRRFRDLPVRIVIRLCTDENDVVQYYNELDKELEYSVDVIDDFRGEAVEVAKMNPWLNYGLPLHRVREMGMKHRVIDLLDERALSKNEYKLLCSILFGEEAMLQAPNPAREWTAFVGYVGALQKEEQHQWDPITATAKPWVDFGARKGKSKVLKAKRMDASAPLFGCFGW